MKDHHHVWRLSGHLDGCHSYTSAYACLCGAVRNVGSERDFTEDGMGWAMWYDSECARCRELADGDTPQSWDEVVPAK